MLSARKPLLALLLAGLFVGSCTGGEDPTGVRSADVGLSILPALIPSAANGTALPIHRIRAVVQRQPDGALLREQRFDVSPTAASWAIDVNVPVVGDGVEVVVYIYLLHVAEDGTEVVQFSGVTEPLTVSVGTRLTNVDADLVRGPLENLGVTAVSITSSPSVVYVGETGDFSASVTPSGSTFDVFWTSLDPDVLTMADSVGTGVSEGTARVVASAGAFADTVSVSVAESAPPTGGAVNTWVGQSGNWSSASNWSLQRTPAAADTVRFTQGSGYTVTLDVSDTVAAVVVGGGVTLGMGNNALTMTGSGNGPELDIQPSGVLEIVSGVITAAGITNAGTLRSTGSSVIVADTIRTNGQWRAEAGIQLVGLTTATWLETDSLLHIETDAAIQLGPNSQVHYLGGTMEGTGLLLLTAGTTLTAHQDLLLDGPLVVMQGASMVGQGTERITIGAASLIELISTATDSAVVRTDTLQVDGEVYATGPDARIRAPIVVGETGILDFLSSGEPASVITGSIRNAGELFVGGNGDVRFGPGAGGTIVNEATGYLQTFPLIDGMVVIDGQLENYGTIDIDGPTQLVREDAAGNAVTVQHLNALGATLELYGTGSLHIALGGTGPAPTFTNAGTILVDTETTLSVENLTNPPGEIRADSTAVFQGDGTVDLTGAAPSMPNLTGFNNGTIRPGSFGPGIMTWAGTVPMGPTGVIEMAIDGSEAGTGFDQLNISAQLVLNGSGKLDLSGSSYSPFAGERFPIISYGTRVGDFAEVILPTAFGVQFDTFTVVTPDISAVVPDTFVVVVVEGPSPVAADWPLDEGQGDIAFDVGAQRNDGILGTVQGQTDPQNPTWLAQGRLGSALSFNTAHVVQVADDPSLEPGELTVEAFVRAPDSPGLFRYVVSKGGGPTSATSASYALYTGGDGGLVFYTSVNGSSAATYYSTSVPPTSIWDGNWHHVAGTFDGFQVALWVDGVQVGMPSPAAIGYSTPQGALAIGALAPTDTFYGFTGDIDEVRLSRRVLTAAEIQARASRGAP